MQTAEHPALCFRSVIKSRSRVSDVDAPLKVAISRLAATSNIAWRDICWNANIEFFNGTALFRFSAPYLLSPLAVDGIWS